MTESVVDRWRKLIDEIDDLLESEPPENSRQRQLTYKHDEVTALLREIRDGWQDER